MGACHSKKKVCYPSRQMTGDMDDELRQKMKHLDLFRYYTSRGDDELFKQDFNAAVEHYEKALEEINLVDMSYRDCAAIISTVYQRFGLLYRYKKQYVMALEWQKKAIDMRQSRIPDDDAFIAGGYSSLGLAYQDIKDYNNALKCYEKALELRLELFGPDHWVTAISYERIALLKALQGFYEEALEFVNKAYDCRKDQGESSIYMAYNLEIKGHIYFEQNNYEEAMNCYRKAIDKLNQAELPNCDMLEEMGKNMMHGEVQETFNEHPYSVKHEIGVMNKRLEDCQVGLERIEETQRKIESVISLAREVESITLEQSEVQMRDTYSDMRSGEEVKEIGVALLA